MTKEEFLNKINKFDIEITNEKIEMLEKYKDFLIEYNKHTNLTRIDSEEDIYLKHFYDSLTILNVVNLKEIDSLIDVGTGAGFPGMVLKIMFPSIKVTLLDSNNKKIKFLEELKKILNIDVNLINDRVEDFSKNNLNKYDVVTSRAVANLRVLSEICLPLVKKDGYFIPLKGNIEEELKESKDTISILNGEIITINSFNIYGNRNILLIKKNDNSSIKDIRTYDKILKKPLVKR